MLQNKTQYWIKKSSEFIQGSFATVYKGRKGDSKERLAIKIPNGGITGQYLTHMKEAQRVAEEEYTILSHLLTFERCEQIMYLNDSFYKSFKPSDSSEKVNLRCFVFEYYKSDLLEYVVAFGQPGLKEEVIAPILKQILQGVAWIHKCGIIHRDLKLENVLLKGHSIKIVDFGLSILKDSKKPIDVTIPIGSPEYAAPETFMAEFHTSASDIWSIGIMFYALLFGRVPYPKETTLSKLWIQNLKGRKQIGPSLYACKLPFPISVQAMDLLFNMLSYHPQKRCDAETLLKHPWFVQCSK